MSPSLTIAQKLEKTAIRAALAASDVLMKGFGKQFDVREKRGQGLVTDFDIRAEKTALKILCKSFPEFDVIAEEDSYKRGLKKTTAAKVSSAEGAWIIDPLDGTTNFVHGFPMFCVSIACEYRGHLQTGVIYHPVFKDLYVASRGRGATLNGRPIHVSRRPKLRQACLTTGFTYRKDRWLKAEMRAFESMSKLARAVRRPGSAALDLAYTARGVFDGFWERRLSPWDVAAGALLVAEAGGKVTDFRGQPFHYTQPEILASNRKLHSEMLKHLTHL